MADDTERPVTAEVTEHKMPHPFTGSANHTSRAEANQTSTFWRPPKPPQTAPAEVEEPK